MLAKKISSLAALLCICAMLFSACGADTAPTASISTSASGKAETPNHSAPDTNDTPFPSVTEGFNGRML